LLTVKKSRWPMGAPDSLERVPKLDALVKFLRSSLDATSISPM